MCVCGFSRETEASTRRKKKNAQGEQNTKLDCTTLAFAVNKHGNDEPRMSSKNLASSNVPNRAIYAALTRVYEGNPKVRANPKTMQLSSTTCPAIVKSQVTL